MSKIYLDAIQSSKTYGGCMEGAPSRVAMLEICQRRAEEAFGGGRPVARVGTYLDDLEDRLPEWLNIAWLVSYQSITPDGDGSHLVVYWLSHRPPNEGFNLDEILAPIDWNNQAKDFWY